jgi:hypothetical protein
VADPLNFLTKKDDPLNIKNWVIDPLNFIFTNLYDPLNLTLEHVLAKIFWKIGMIPKVTQTTSKKWSLELCYENKC